LFLFENDAYIQTFLSGIKNSQIRTIGPELVFGKVFDFIDFNAIEEPLFRHLVIASLAFLLSKLKTLNIYIDIKGYH